jgi:hypothetical protein
MTRWLTAGILAALVTCACEKKDEPSTQVGANLGLAASATPPTKQGHEATHIQQQKPTSSAPVGGSKTETIGGSKSVTVGGSK